VAIRLPLAAQGHRERSVAISCSRYPTPVIASPWKGRGETGGEAGCVSGSAVCYTPLTPLLLEGNLLVRCELQSPLSRGVAAKQPGCVLLGAGRSIPALSSGVPASRAGCVKVL